MTMIDYRLTSKQLDELRAAHREASDIRSAYRIHTVILLGQGWSVAQVSDALLIDSETVRRYFKRYRKGGIEELLRMSYVGGEALLDEQQLAELDAHLQTKVYLSAKSVAAWVEERWGVRYTESGMAALLRRLGYRYKKPKLIPGKADPEAQREFLATDYKNAKENSGEGGPLYFADGVHPQHNPIAGYGWIKRGKDFPLPTNTGRRRLNINGAIDITTMAAEVRMDDTINGESTLALIQQIEAKHPDCPFIPIICDNASYYRSKAVQEYLETSRVELIFLPPYSPNLNLIERLWRFMKREILYGTYYPTFKEFKTACETFFRELGSYESKLRSLLTENFQILGV
jgi:transposase